MMHLSFYVANCSTIQSLVNTLFTHMPRLFVDNLTVIDCSILDPERGLIGASWSVNIELLGELDHQSMVFDFAKVKKTIKQIIDNEVDHKLVIPNDYSGLSIQHSTSSNVNINFTDQNQELITHSSPKQAVCFIDSTIINQGSVINYLTDIILRELPSNVRQLNIELHDEAADGNYYCYSHGLKKHDGNCQRIAHGHRSQIQIWQNNVRDDSLEKHIAQKWHDIYLGTDEDIINNKNGRIEFQYTTDQGLFEISLPEHRVHIMDCDSTVECIAEHLLSLTSKLTKSNTSLKVKAFEGIGKGAIAQSK